MLMRGHCEVRSNSRADAHREVALAEATEKASKAMGTKLYSVIYADPPWRFEPYSRDTGMDRAADNHYPTMTIENLLAMKVPAARTRCCSCGRQFRCSLRH